MIVSRRKLFGLGATFVAAPAIVRVASLMPISVPRIIVPQFTTESVITVQFIRSMEELMERYLRPQMLIIERRIDADIMQGLAI